MINTTSQENVNLEINDKYINFLIWGNAKDKIWSSMDTQEISYSQSTPNIFPSKYEMSRSVEMMKSNNFL